VTRHTLAPLLLLLALSVAAPPAWGELAGPTPLPGVAASSDRFGIVEAFQARELARRSGARWQRFAFFWNSIQPDSPDQWLPNHYSTEADVANSIADGIKPVGVLGNPPAWATRNGSVPKNLMLPPSDPENYWARFVGRIAGQYAGQIDDWIIWNEPDITPDSGGSSWAGGTDEYYQLLKLAWQAARAANPRARIVFAGTTYWFDVSRGNRQFFDRVLEVASRDPSAAANGYYFDAVDIHIYSAPTQVWDLTQAFREIMRRYGLSKPIWISELNVVPTNDPAAMVPRGGYRASLDEQASFVIQALALARAADVQRASIYKMIDGKVVNGEPFGLVRNDLSVRPAYVAFQVAATYLSRPGSATRERQGDVEVVTIDSGDRRTTVVWATGPQATTARIPVSGMRAKLVAKDGTVADLPLPSGQSAMEYTIPLPGATANTDDGNPNNYIIGGSPFILAEEGVGDAITISPQEVYFPKTGFNSSGPFLDYFRHRGGLRTFGYPVSRPLKLEGRTVQFYQRQVMEMRPDGTVGLLNILDEGLMPYTRINGAALPAIDQALIKSAPATGTPGYSSRILGFVRANAPDTWNGLAVGFGRTFAQSVRAEEAYGGQRVDAGVLAGLNLEVWGVPTSKPARDPGNDSFVYQRFQRGVMHYDRGTGVTQGLLLADYLKAIITGRNLPADLEAQARTSRLYRQYDNTRPLGLARPEALRDTDMTNAFERGR